MRLHWFVTFRANRLGLLRKIAPSWLYSPWRRIVQAAAFATFLVMLFWVLQPASPPPPDALLPQDLSDAQAARQFFPTDLFLMLDPLANASAAIAARAWVPSLTAAGILLLLSAALPRVFCGYLCPLGTLLDLSDWLVTGRFKRFHVRSRGGYANVKYYLLIALLGCSAFGLLLSGYLSAIPLVTRGLTVSIGYLQASTVTGLSNLPPLEWQNYAAVALLLGVLALSLMGKRFWCRCVCPTGAVFSLMSLLRLTQRKVSDRCVECGQCAKACAFGAVHATYGTRTADCTFCQTCGGACPAGAITFTHRWHELDAKPADPAPHVSLSRRGFLAAGVGGLMMAAVPLYGRTGREPLIRPPGANPEERFLDLCIRCGQCMKACPTNLLQPAGLHQKLEQIWTPQANADYGRCDPTCNLCGKVCPTGAIRLLTVEEKRRWRMGLAEFDSAACLAYQGKECSFCGDACAAAGYEAIEFLEPDREENAPRASRKSKASAPPDEPSAPGLPIVDSDRCAGCGACQNACHVNRVRTGKLARPAIRVKPREERIEGRGQ